MAAWIAGIARRIAIESKRKRARYAKVFGQHTSEQPIDRDAIQVPGPEAELLAREELVTLARMKMSVTQRECVRLTALGFTAREIGERLGIPEETAASCVKRARAAYRKAQAKQHK